MARVLFVVSIAFFAVACAEAGSKNPGSADASTSTDALTFGFPDANNNGVPDARLSGPPDAPTFSVPDASTQGTIDALPPGSNLFCSTHSDCTTAGECCFTFGQPPGFCVVGTEIGPLCLPQ